MFRLLKKLILFALILWGVYVFYQKFTAPALEPFFKEKAGSVDLFSITVDDYESKVKEQNP